MKKILLLLAAVGMIFTACETGSDNDGSESCNYDIPDSPLNELECAPNEILYITTNGKPLDLKQLTSNMQSSSWSDFEAGYIMDWEWGVDENGVGRIIFEKEIKTIPDDAFSNCNILYVKLPNTIKYL